MAAPEGTPHAQPFERIEEYKAILDDANQLASRREQGNNVFISLNTFFLAAIGFFIPSHLDSWFGALSVVILSLVAFPANLTWRISLQAYAKNLEVHYDYLRKMESEFQERSRTPDKPSTIGFYLTLASKAPGLPRPTQLQKALATFFMILYPVIAIGLLVLTSLTQSGLIAPLRLG